MVVRNPFERMVSEFNYFNEQKEFGIKEFNFLLSQEIVKKSKNRQGHHYSPQHLYCKGNIDPHILRYENLEEEFSTLMNMYNMDINLTEKKNSALYWKNARSSKTFTVKDLSPGTVDIILKHYKKDFSIFNYDTKVIT